MNAQIKEHAWVSNGPTKVYQAICAISGELAKIGISKERRNTQQGYQFRGIDDVYSALSSLLAQYKLCVIPRVLGRTVTERETKSGGVLFYAIVDVEFDLVSAEDGSRHTARIVGEAMDSGDKATNKAMSAAYKYFALQTFCIPTEGDNDADSSTHEVKGKHDPRGDLGVNISPDFALALAEKMRAILNADHEENIVAMRALDLTDELRGKNDEYAAAWKLMDSKERSAWKRYVDLGHKLAAQEQKF